MTECVCSHGVNAWHMTNVAMATFLQVTHVSSTKFKHDLVCAMSNVPFSQRLGAFKQRFQQVLGNRGSGYDELAQLEQPLVGDDSSYGGGDDYQRSHGVSAPGQYSGFGSATGGGTGGMSAGSALPSHVNQTIPSQVRQHDLPEGAAESAELQLVTSVHDGWYICLGRVSCLLGQESKTTKSKGSKPSLCCGNPIQSVACFSDTGG